MKYKVTLSYEIEVPGRLRPALDILVFHGVNGVTVAGGWKDGEVIVKDVELGIVPVKKASGS